MIHYFYGNYSYFIEKRRQDVYPQKENTQMSEINVKEKAFKTKEKKREEAEERNKISKVETL
jgi:hypothetical protein